ncbi:MAG: RAMP superfamily CRISPR-associated protein [Candidatus Adiutrix sp.]|jgi:CRISPR/Cas system CMR subunit Cmr4 (Cas7 group RAMP superfamily)|nr:RAMP superfamily CRISPR-associated protein [Candidatus Adiutrix sp.]
MIYLARFIIELVTPLHCGGGEDDGFDQPVVRDAFGLYRLPGSTVAGLLRREAGRLAPDDPEAVAELFGRLGPRHEDGRGSQIWCHDARLLDFESGRPADLKKMAGLEVQMPLGPYIRDHVRLSNLEVGEAAKGGTAETGGKFDEEYVPAGARFALEFFLDGWSGEPSPQAVAMFKKLCAAVKAGAVRFGGKAAEGFGEVKALESKLRRFDLKSEAGLAGWLNLSEGPGFAEAEGERLEIAGYDRPPTGQGLSGRLRIPLVGDGPLLVGGGVILPEARDSQGSEEEADLVFYREPFFDYGTGRAIWRKVVPGSSLRGLLRHRARRVVQALTAADAPANTIIAGLFGEVDSGDQGRPGKLSVADAPLPESPGVRVQHVAIDRFTGGALDAHLFDETPLWRNGLELELRLAFEGLNATEAAVLAQALADLLTGQAAVGGGGNRGHGFLKLKKSEAPGGQTLAGLKGQMEWDGEFFRPADGGGPPETWLARLDQALAELEDKP